MPYRGSAGNADLMLGQDAWPARFPELLPAAVPNRSDCCHEGYGPTPNWGLVTAQDRFRTSPGRGPFRTMQPSPRRIALTARLDLSRGPGARTVWPAAGSCQDDLSSDFGSRICARSRDMRK